MLSWRLSNTLDASFCVEALEEAIARYGKPEIMNTDHFTQLKLSHPEMEKFVKPKGTIGAYLWYLYTNNPLHEMFAITDPETKTWVIWDIINVAWLFSGNYVSMYTTTSPVLNDSLYWEKKPDNHLMSEAYDLNRDAIFEDFYRTLDRAP